MSAIFHTFFFGNEKNIKNRFLVVHGVRFLLLSAELGKREKK